MSNQEPAKSNSDFDWTPEQIDAISEAVNGRTAESLDIQDATDYQLVVITFADGLQLRIECDHIKAVDPIEPQHI